MTRLEGKIAIISGGSKGIGKATVERFVQEGAKVVFTARGKELGEALEEELGGNAKYVQADSTSLEDWMRAVQTAEEEFGPVNILVNSAGVGGEYGLVEEISEEGYREILDINLIGPFLGMKAAIPSIKRAGKPGSIVNVSSTGGMAGSPGFAGYCSAKFGMRGLTKVAALELASSNIRVNTVHPGAVMTPLLQGGNLDVDMVNSITPMGRISEPEEMANLILFLASDESSYSTGSEFIADGGVLANIY